MVTRSGSAMRSRPWTEQSRWAIHPGTVTVMRSALLFEEGLFTDARRELESAETRAPDDPTLLFLFSHLYEHIGLSGKPRQALQRAQSQTR